MVNWLKLLHTTPRNPKLRELMRSLKTKDKDSALGLAVRWLIYIDEQTTDGCTGLLPRELDDELARKGAAAALQACGWAELNDAGHICAVDFGKHCGATAKKRASEARKKALQREAEKACAAEKRPEENGTNVPETAGAAHPSAPSAERDFSYSAWLVPLVAAHPAGKRWKPTDPLPADAILAAAAAYEADPTAAAHAELLAAYLADKLREDRRGVPFFRPKLLRVYFEQLGTTIAEAERWKAERGWKPRTEKTAARRKPEHAANDSEQMTDAERAAFFRELHETPKPTPKTA